MTTPPPELTKSQCATLAAYDSSQQAWALFRVEHARNRPAYTGPKKPYECPHCKRWHLGYLDESQEYYLQIELAVAEGKR